MGRSHQEKASDKTLESQNGPGLLAELNTERMEVSGLSISARKNPAQ